MIFLWTSKILWPSLLFGLGPLFGLCFMKKNKYHLSPQFLVPNFSRNDTVLHLESLNFGFGSPFGPCFMKNRVLAGSLFLDSRYPVLVTMVLPFSLKIWFRSTFWQWILIHLFFGKNSIQSIIQNLNFQKYSIQKNIQNFIYQKYSIKKIFKTLFIRNIQFKKIFIFEFPKKFNSKILFKTGFFPVFNSKKYSFNTKKEYLPGLN